MSRPFTLPALHLLMPQQRQFLSLSSFFEGKVATLPTTITNSNASFTVAPISDYWLFLLGETSACLLYFDKNRSQTLTFKHMLKDLHAFCSGLNYQLERVYQNYYIVWPFLIQQNTQDTDIYAKCYHFPYNFARLGKLDLSNLWFYKGKNNQTILKLFS